MTNKSCEWSLGLQYQDLEAECEELEIEIRMIEDKCSYLKDNGDTLHNSDGQIELLRERKKLLTEKIKECNDLRRKIEDKIASMPSRERRFMRLRYIQGMTLTEISYEMYYSIEWCKDEKQKILSEYGLLDKEKETD